MGRQNNSQYKEFRRAEIPRAQDYEDQTILVIETDGTRSLLFSDGRTWTPSGGGGVALSAGTNSLSSGTVAFSNSNGITFGMNTAGVVTASVAGTVAGGGQLNVSAGLSSANVSSLVFSNSNAMTFGASTAANGATITGSFAQSNQTLGGFAVGNSTQSSSGTIDARSLSVQGVGGISVGVSNGSLIVSGPVSQTAQTQSVIQAVQAGTTSANTGAISFSNANGVSFGLAGQTMTGSVAAQTNQTLGVFATGNSTQSSSGTIDARSLTVQGAGAVSVGVSNGSLVISAAAGAQSNQTLGLFGSSQTTGQSSSTTVDARSLSIVGAGDVSVGMSAGSLIISGGAAGGAAFGESAGTQSVSTGTMVWSNSNGISFGMSGSSRITASMALSNQVVSAFAVGNTTQSSSGTVNVSAVSLSGAGAVSVGVSNGSIVISAAAGAQSNQTAGVYASSQTTGASSSSTYDARSLSIVAAGLLSVGWSGGSLVLSGPDTTSFNPLSVGFSTGGNTAGTTGFGTDQVVLAGGANITLSGSTNGGSMTVSIVGGSGAAFGVSAGTQSVNTGTMIFSNSNGLTFGMSGSSRITASLALSNQVVSAFAVSNTTQSSSQTVNVSAFSFAGAGAVSVGASNGSIVISAPAASVNVSAGTTSGNLGSVVFSNSNGVSFGLNGSTVTGSVATSLTNVNVSAGTTSQNLSAIVFSNANGVSFGLNGSTVTGSVAAGGAGYTAGLSNIGNTSGNTGVVTGQLVLAGGNNVTLSGSTNAGSMTVTVSAASQTNQSVGLYALGNTTQNSSTTLDARTLSFNALGAMTMGYSNGSVQVSAPATSSLSATGGVSISTNGSTISIGVPSGTISRFEWPPSQAMNVSSSQQTNSALSLQYFSVDQPLSFSRADLPLLVSLSSSGATNTGAIALSALMAIYTRNGSTLSPLVAASASSTLSWASNTANFNNLTGGRQLSFGLATVLTPGEYWAGFYVSTTSGISTGANTTALNGTISVLAGSNYTASAFADFNQATGSSSATHNMGIISSVVTATSQTLQLSQVTMTGTAAFRANVPLTFRNY